MRVPMLSLAMLGYRLKKSGGPPGAPGMGGGAYGTAPPIPIATWGGIMAGLPEVEGCMGSDWPRPCGCSAD